MSEIHTWNDKIVYNDDGFGYIITEGDEEEAIIIEYEMNWGEGRSVMEDSVSLPKRPERKETERMRIHGSKMLRALAEAMIAKADEWETRI